MSGEHFLAGLFPKFEMTPQIEADLEAIKSAWPGMDREGESDMAVLARRVDTIVLMAQMAVRGDPNAAIAYLDDLHDLLMALQTVDRYREVPDEQT